MPGTSIQELLGLPSDVTHPNAYQLFGLELGESEQETIEHAINQRIASLKQAREDAAPEVWKRAAALVVAAQQTLKDPQAKAELDASFGIIHQPDGPPEAANPASSDDPLASLLPPSANAPVSNPPVLKPQVSSSPRGTPDSATPPMTESTPALSDPGLPSGFEMPPGERATDGSSVTTPNVSNPVSPVVRRRAPVRRRRSWGGLIFGTSVLAILGVLVGGLGYFYLLGPGSVAIVKTDDGYVINTGGRRETTPVASRPQSPDATSVLSPPNPRSDGIMKTPPPVRGNGNGSLANDMRSDDVGTSPSGMGMTPQQPPSSPTPDPAPDPEPTPAPTPDPEPTPEPEPTKPPTPETISIGQVAIEKARDSIRTADWEQMKPLAETAESAAVTPQQKQLAETIYQYADLATYYRGAVLRAVPALSFGQEIQVTETMKVMVQEVSETQLTINRGKDGSGKPQLKSFAIGEIPLVLAHALAPSQLDIDSPEGQAAKAVYQAIGPFSTAGRRGESIEILRGLQKVEGADPQRLADFLDSLGG